MIGTGEQTDGWNDGELCATGSTKVYVYNFRILTSGRKSIEKPSSQRHWNYTGITPGPHLKLFPKSTLNTMDFLIVSSISAHANLWWQCQWFAITTLVSSHSHSKISFSGWHCRIQHLKLMSHVQLENLGPKV